MKKGPECSKCGGLRDTKMAYCSSCNKAYQREHYRLNKKKYRDKAKANRDSLKQKLYDFLSDKQCIDCGESRIPTLQFDHVRGRKDRAIAEMVRDSCSWSRIVREIAKCDIRCANCHAIRTAEHCGWYSFLSPKAK